MPARVRSLKIGFTFGGTALAAQQADAAILSAESGADGRIRTGDPLFTNQTAIEFSLQFWRCMYS